MSPEQTGRMNRLVDSRSDLYSLGVTLYELIAGAPPFVSADPLELIYSHVARPPLQLAQRVPGLPATVAAVVHKLLAKEAEERYQSASGLRADLQECLQRLDAGGQIAPFALGKSDRSEGLRIPQKLYGRQEEARALMDAFARTAAGAVNLLLLSGYAGVGKSALVHEVYKGIARRGGYFVAGKFEQLNRHVPYAALASALRDLVQQILTEPADKLAEWRRRLQEAVGKSGQLLTNLLPELTLVLGPQPPLPEVGPTEAQTRFMLSVQRFVSVFSARAPLVLFLDDLHWIDPASLQLLQQLLGSPDSRHLLIIGAYRGAGPDQNHEQSDAHPLALTVEVLRSAGARCTELALGPLDRETVETLLDETLDQQRGAAAELAQLVWDKTQGNPFFVNQFLLGLHQSGLLWFDATAGRWTWDVQRIQAAEVTDNVVDFLLGKLRRLSPAAQQLLKLGACLGFRFPLELLAALRERDQADTAGALWEAQQEGLIVALAGEYRFLAAGRSALAVPGTELPVAQIWYRFLHDRIQQAAYALGTPAERAELHLRIGRLLQAQGDVLASDERLFELVNHFSEGAALIHEATERAAVLKLAIAAGRRAKAAAAHAAAADYYQTGIELLAKQAGHDEHELRFALHLEHAECLFLSTKFSAASAELAALREHARTDLEHARLQLLEVSLHFVQGDFRACIATGRAALQLLGVAIPVSEAEHPAALGAVLAEIAANQRGRTPRELLDAPIMTDPEQQLVAELLTKLVAAAYSTNMNTFALVAAQLVNCSLKHGNCPSSSFGYSIYSLLLACMLGRTAEAQAFCQLGLALLEKLPSASLISKVYFTTGMICHRFEPLRAALGYYERSLAACLEHGDREFFASAYSVPSRLLFFTGAELAEVRANTDRCLALDPRTLGVIGPRMVWAQRAIALHLLGDPRAPGPAEEQAEEQTLAAAQLPMATCFFSLTRLLRLYLFEEYAPALAAALATEQLAWSIVGQCPEMDLPLFASLVRTALYPTATPAEQALYQAAIAGHRAQLAAWMESHEGNYQHRLLLVDAELARISGRADTAITLYEQAITAARRNGFPHHAALASELCARFHLERGRQELAGFYLREALHGYKRWGAQAKVQLLQQRHAALLAADREFADARAAAPDHPVSAKLLDMNTVLHTAQTLASELDLERVLQQLMGIVLRDAGAQRGFLLIPRGEHLVLSATMRTEPDEVKVGLQQPLASDCELATTVVYYVARCRETVNLDHPSADRRFAADPHIAARGPKSILCLALLHQGRLTGILYLEHRGAHAAFSPERQELLRHLSAQAATAIENAELYAEQQRTSQELKRSNQELEALIAQRTSQLSESNAHLVQTTRQLKEANERLQQELADRMRSEQARTVLQEEIIRVQTARLAEMATPVIPITDEIMVMPLIGTVDAQRAHQVLQTALSGASSHRAKVVILDITGMTKIDGAVAQTLVSTASALRLLGSRMILTGLRAEFAQLLVGLDIELGAILTHSTLQRGIAHAYQLIDKRAPGSPRR